MNCECEFSFIFEDATEAPICGKFDPVSEDDCADCCRQCRHSEDCHNDPMGEFPVSLEGVG